MGREKALIWGGTSKAMTLTCCLGMKLQGLPAWKLRNGVATKQGRYLHGNVVGLAQNECEREVGRDEETDSFFSGMRIDGAQ